MKNYHHVEGTNITTIYQSTITEKELANMGYKLFKYTWTVNRTTVQFIGNYKTHEVSVMFRLPESVCIKILSSGKKTEDCIGDKRSFLKGCFASAFGAYLTYQLTVGATMSGKEFDVTKLGYELDVF